MKYIGKALLTISVIPFFLILIISVLNRDPQVNLKFLTWKTPKVSLGLSIFIATTIGATYSATSAISSQSKSNSLRRTVHINNQSLNYDDDDEFQAAHNQYNDIDNEEEYNFEPSPQRDIRDPAPTISVPFRVKQRGSGHFSDEEISYANKFNEELFEKEEESLTDVHSEENINPNPQEKDWRDLSGEEW